MREGMTFSNWQKRKRLNVRLLQPELAFCGEEIDSILTQILAAHFPEKTTVPGIFFGRTPTLAHIDEARDEHRTTIWMHHALNDPATPEYVFRHVLKHELIHTRVGPRNVDGKWVAHPPEFWEEEERIGHADRVRAWEWVSENFRDALRWDREHECVWVNQNRMKQLLRLRRGEPDRIF
jgi:hypothetical protein